MTAVKAYATQSATSKLAPFTIERRDVGDNDVQIDILYSGVCHSDIHQARDEWGESMYPMVPGHEIFGKVLKVGKNVKKFKIGDLAAVGVMVDSCQHCKQCNAHLEQYCDEGMTGTYNANERSGKGITMGGYSTQIVTDQRFVYTVSDKLDAKGIAPLLCAGITTYSPLRYVGASKGHKIGVVGLGGLGHMAVKFAVSFGAEVTMLSTSKSKEADARKLGAHNFALTTDKDQMKKLSNHFDIIVNTISANHDYANYLRLLGVNGKMIVVGLPHTDPVVSPFDLVGKRRSIVGSMIGGTEETQQMLDYCAEKNIVSDVEVIPMSYINEAYERMIKNDVKYRFVIDMKTLK
jgi:uncharacterized zinc-type alcohol dehydrogenase-like protein